MIPKTLNEARAQGLDLFYHLSMTEAEINAHGFAQNGRCVVAIIREILQGATREHFVVVIKPRPRVVMPQGFEKRK